MNDEHQNADELVELLRKTNWKHLEATRPFSGGEEQEQQQARAEFNISDLCRLYAEIEDRQWHSKKKLIPLFGCRSLLNGVLDYLLCAESDHGRFICLPDDGTPSSAPDEILE